MATSEENPYECPVCLNDMMERNPKLLQCHHSFCLNCLETLVANNRITCPTCRTPTNVPTGGIRQLSTDFHLIRMYEREQKLLTEFKKVNIELTCQMCHRVEGVNKCQDCFKRMCGTCTDKHGRVSQFKSHVVQPLCPTHVEGITHICMKCVKSVCTACVVMEHEEHESEVKLYDDGIKELKSRLDSFKGQVSKKMELVEAKQSQDENRKEVNKEIKVAIEKIHKDNEDRAAESKRLVQMINQIYDQNWNSVSDYVHKVNKVYTSILSELHKLEKGDGENLVHAFNSKKLSLETQFSAMQNERQVEYSVSPFVTADPGCNEIVRYWKQGENKVKWLADPKRVLHLTNSSNAELQLLYPLQIIHAQKSVFISNGDPKRVLRLDENGDIMSVYFPYKPTSDVRGLALYDDYLYIHTEQEITRLPLGYQSDRQRTVYKPKVSRIWKILVLNREKSHYN